MFELLNKTDVENIVSWIRAYGPGNDGTPAVIPTSNEMAPLSYLLRHWDNAKEKSLRKLFGSNLILRKNYSYNIPQSAIQANLERRFLHNNNFAMLYKVWKKVLNEEIVFIDKRYDLLSICSFYAFVKGNCEDSFTSVYFYFQDNELTNHEPEKRFSFNLRGQSKPFLLYPTMKPMKVIRKILDVYGDDYDPNWRDYYETVRLEVSRALNNAHLSGELCLSIHPLDYITMSDNENNWSSCMRWRRNGEYSQGTIEMMNSPIVVVAYLHNPKNTMILPNGNHWNNKIWRQLWIVDDDIITEVKAYPYDDANISQYVYNWLKELATNSWAANYNLTTEIEGDDSATRINNNTEIFYTFNNGYMYNDFGCAPRNHIAGLDTHRINIKYKITKSKHENAYYADVPYSGASECMWCGEDITRDWDDNYSDDDSISGQRICNYCSDYGECQCCGQRVPRSELTCVDGILVCDCCWDDHVVYDAFTGEAMYYNNYNDVDVIHLATGDEDHFEFTGDVIYVRDKDNISNYEKYFTHSIREWQRYWTIKNFVLVSDCTPEGLNIFDFNP